jgi:hypothetical protein
MVSGESRAGAAVIGCARDAVDGVRVRRAEGERHTGLQERRVARGLDHGREHVSFGAGGGGVDQADAHLLGRFGVVRDEGDIDAQASPALGRNGPERVGGELLVAGDAPGTERALAGVAVLREELGVQVAHHKVQPGLRRADARVEQMRHRVLHPADERHVRGQARHAGARVVDEHDQVGAELGARAGVSQHAELTGVVGLDEHAGLMAQTLERAGKVGGGVLDERGESARGDEHAERLGGGGVGSERAGETVTPVVGVLADVRGGHGVAQADEFMLLPSEHFAEDGFDRALVSRRAGGEHMAAQLQVDAADEEVAEERGRVVAHEAREAVGGEQRLERALGQRIEERAWFAVHDRDERPRAVRVACELLVSPQDDGRGIEAINVEGLHARCAARRGLRVGRDGKHGRALGQAGLLDERGEGFIGGRGVRAGDDAAGGRAVRRERAGLFGPCVEGTLCRADADAGVAVVVAPEQGVQVRAGAGDALVGSDG